MPLHPWLHPSAPLGPRNLLRTIRTMSTTLGIGIIGFGRIGAEHAGWLKTAKNARAVAVADATPARQAIARERGLAVYDDIPSLLADAKVQAVLVATPTAMHR